MYRSPVDILLPVWNQHDTLQRAIQSVWHERDHLIIVDDGSDEPVHFQPGPTATLIRIEHGGIAKALNAGLKKCRHEYVMRQDADDVSYPGRADVLAQILNTNKWPAASSWFMYEMRGPVIKHGMVHAFPPILRRDDLLNGWRFPHGPAMYRRDRLEAVGGWPEDMEASEDHLLHLILATEGGGLPVFNQVLYWVGQGPNRQTNRYDMQKWDAEAVRRWKEWAKKNVAAKIELQREKEEDA